MTTPRQIKLGKTVEISSCGSNGRVFISSSILQSLTRNKNVKKME